MRPSSTFAASIVQAFFFLLTGTFPLFTTGCSIQLLINDGQVVSPPGDFNFISATPANGKVTLVWDSSERAATYTVTYGTSSGSYTTTASTNATSPFQVTGLPNDTTYYFMVTAVNSGGSRAAAVERSATPLYCIDYPTATSHTAMGSGTLADPHYLCTAAQLASIGANTSDWHKHYKVMQDIDLADYTEAADGTRWIPIGTLAAPFTGSFDGNGKLISNLAYTDVAYDYLGFFGYVRGSKSVIKNVKLRNISIRGRDRVGGIAGILVSAEILNSSVTGTVRGVSYVGGLAGMITQGAIVSTSYANVTVGPGVSNHAGGLVGLVHTSSTIANSFASGSVSSVNWAGGLAGSLTWSKILNCYSKANVTITGNIAGGLVGEAGTAYVINSFARPAAITATINGGSGVGPIYGSESFGTFTNNYYGSTTAITNNGTGNAINTGGGTVVDLGATPDHFQLAANAPLDQWNFTDSWAIQTGDEPFPSPSFLDAVSWGSCASHLTDTPFAGGAGTIENPWLLCTAAQLNTIAGNAAYTQLKAFKVMANIDLSAYSVANFNMVGAGASSFNGVFDGNGKVISNLNYSAPTTDYVGLFSRAAYAIIKHVGIENFAIRGDSYIGILGGSMGHTALVNNYVRNSSIDGVSVVGGIAGSSLYLGTSYMTGTVAAAGSYVGGILGYNPNWNGGGTNNFVIADVSQTAGSVSGPTVGLDSGPNVFAGSYYDSSKTCTNCDNATGNGVNLPLSPTYFYSKTNAPLSAWDFDNIWQENAGSLPTLR